MRLLIHVEGQTEESFVNEILCDFLIGLGYEDVSARIIGNARLRRRRGGIRPWPSVRRDIVNHLKQDRSCVATTMVDYYGLPQNGERAWPGRAQASGLQSAEKGPFVEEAIAEDLAREYGQGFARNRFVPFVVMHEFEGLLFSDCVAFSNGIGRTDLQMQLVAIRNAFPTPEDINDSPVTCPSMRIKGLIPAYEKPLFGTLAALEIGLPAMQAQCPHFAAWIQRLQATIV